MSRKHLAIIGIALAILLAAGSTVLILAPWAGQSSTKPGQTRQVHAEAGDTVITLTWQTLDGAHGYFVYRDGSKTPLSQSPIVETRYEDIGLSNGRTYRYEIAPLDAAGVPGKRTAQVQAIPRSR